MSKVTWNDIQNGTQKELKKTYKLDSRQMETQVRRHLEGANAKERRQVYQNFFSRRDK